MIQPPGEGSLETHTNLIITVIFFDIPGFREILGLRLYEM
jgi:hypothetical protein